ncbi:MAG: FG-GAP-like repeat-containing protein [Acidobacteriaceae bacterium]
MLRRTFLPVLCIVLLLATFVHAQTPMARQHQARTLNNLGTALVNQQLLQPAAQKFAQAYKLDPQLSIAETNEGIALFYLGQTQKSEQLLLAAAKQNSRDPYTWYVLGLLYQGRGQSAQATEAFRHVLAIDPHDPDTLYFLGSSELSLHHLKMAIADFQSALKINPLHASAEYGLASAFRMSGNMPQALAHLRRFEQLRSEKVSSPLSHNYGDEGKYSTTQIIRPSNTLVGPMIPVTFVRQPQSGPALRTAAASSFPSGGGACMIRSEPNGPLYLIVPSSGTAALHPYRFTTTGHGTGEFERVSAAKMGLDATGHALSCAVGDYNNDGLPDLAVAFTHRIALYRNIGHGKFVDVTSKADIRPLNQPTGLTFVDYDHDGDLDLLVTGHPAHAGSSANILWRNNGNGTFTDVTRSRGFFSASATTSATLSDLNNDRAVDFVVTGSGSSPTLYINRREGPFLAKPMFSIKGLPPTNGVAVFDYNKDGWMDIALTHDGAPGVTLWRNVDGKYFQRVPLPIHDAIRAWGITPVDIDNDGWIDLAVIIDTAHGPQLRVLRNLGPRGFQDVTAKLGLNKLKLHHPRSLIAADLYGSGAPDLIITQLHRPPMVLINHGGNKNHSLEISLHGLADNKMAIGTKVEVFSDNTWQKWEVASSSGYLSQGPDEIIAGLGKDTHADIVRLLWPTGVPQDELHFTGKTKVSIAELDRRGSSCPTLFTWNGHKYTFISDVIGAAVVGHWTSPTTVNTPDPGEWIKIPGQDLKSRNGYFSLRFGEPMEEVNYLDQVRLVAVDHPIGTRVYPNERFLSEPPFPREKVILSADAHPVAAAWGNHGHNATALLRAKDDRYLEDFTDLPYDGFAKMHSLTLDLGKWNPNLPLHLLLNGYVNYFSASSMYSAWQAGLKPIPPYIDAQLPNGQWKRVVNDMGFPAGLPRTIVVNLTGKLPSGTRRIRITTNLQIYWNQILVDNAPADPGAIHQIPLHLASANLAFRGYPQQIALKAPGLITYNYNSNSQTGPFRHARGDYTRYGNVTPLLENIDNRFVIFGTGEDLDLEFSATSLPPLPTGWTRDYFFYANGFVKDMDFYEARPYTVGPMPYHGMASYPPPTPPPLAVRKTMQAYELEWNTRYERLGNTHPYVFHYVMRNMHPPVMPPAAANPIASDSAATASGSGR